MRRSTNTSILPTGIYRPSSDILAFPPSVEPGESDLPYVIDKLGEGCLMFASDFPHENNLTRVKEDIREFEDLEGISDNAKSGILAKNAESFYGISKS